ncbi:MAG: sulfotransferase [Oceanicaulis sp.]|uniref:sulfotransferase n=1 Tax=Glycocaulis sp. TaxID=1969725 RepID=UPI0025BA0BE5|nr:sulfotransferase [Glycocaulis sp.]MCC5981219.1 sulfotransferase [Oceanicaulis sp.]MCH8522884.1 sulfotransferase [Glycocaulis sp.]
MRALIFKRAVRRAVSYASLILSPLDWLIKFSTIKQSRKKYIPIFIVGASRSGTTLVYQAVSCIHKLNYVNSIISKMPYAPIFAIFITKTLFSEKEISFQSEYGISSGLRAPQQGNEIWSRWLPKKGRPHKNKINSMFHNINDMQSAFNGPMAIKWPGFVAYLEDIRVVNADAFYIFIERDAISNAKSIYKGRLDLNGNPLKTISRIPRSYKYNGRSAAASVCEYIKSSQRDIENFKNHLCESQFVNLKYEDFCKNPKQYIQKIMDRYSDYSGFRLEKFEGIPDSFRVSDGPRLPDDIEGEMQSYLKN